MKQQKIKTILAAGAVATFVLAVAPSAMALETYRTYSEGCDRWSNQGAGQRIKCFDCLRRQKINGRRVWVNTCSHRPY